MTYIEAYTQLLRSVRTCVLQIAKEQQYNLLFHVPRTYREPTSQLAGLMEQDQGKLKPYINELKTRIDNQQNEINKLKYDAATYKRKYDTQQESYDELECKLVQAQNMIGQLEGELRRSRQHGRKLENRLLTADQLRKQGSAEKEEQEPSQDEKKSQNNRERNLSNMVAELVSSQRALCRLREDKLRLIKIQKDIETAANEREKSLQIELARFRKEAAETKKLFKGIDPGDDIISVANQLKSKNTAISKELQNVRSKNDKLAEDIRVSDYIRNKNNELQNELEKQEEALTELRKTQSEVSKLHKQLQDAHNDKTELQKAAKGLDRAQMTNFSLRKELEVTKEIIQSQTAYISSVVARIIGSGELAFCAFDRSMQPPRHVRNTVGNWLASTKQWPLIEVGDGALSTVTQEEHLASCDKKSWSHNIDAPESPQTQSNPKIHAIRGLFTTSIIPRLIPSAAEPAITTQ